MEKAGHRVAKAMSHKMSEAYNRLNEKYDYCDCREGSDDRDDDDHSDDNDDSDDDDDGLH